jgi:hypothetical protein
MVGGGRARRALIHRAISGRAQAILMERPQGIAMKAEFTVLSLASSRQARTHQLRNPCIPGPVAPMPDHG